MTAPADVCVVGGGLLGAATAYYAARLGLAVELYEEHELAAGASGAAFGGVSSMVYSYSATRVPDHYVKLSLEGVRLYGELAEELGPPLDFKVVGHVDPFFDEDDRAPRAERVRSLVDSGSPCELLDGGAIREIEPAVSDEVAGGMWCPTDGHVTPLFAVHALADGARRHGARIHTGVRVDSIHVQSGRVTGVGTSVGDITSGCVIICGGASTASLAAQVGLHLPLDFSRGQMLVTERVPRLLRTTLHNIQQTSAGTIVIGVTREPRVDTESSVAGISDILSNAVRTIPALTSVRLLRAWAGVRIVPVGGYPIFGPAGVVDGLFVCAMHRGVTLAPVVGKALAELAAGKSPTLDIEPYSAERLSGVPAAEVEETFYAHQ